MTHLDHVLDDEEGSYRRRWELGPCANECSTSLGTSPFHSMQTSPVHSMQTTPLISRLMKGAFGRASLCASPFHSMRMTICA